MIEPGPADKLYPVIKLTTIVNALVAEGCSPTEVLSGAHLTKSALVSPATRVSLNQIIECCRNAVRLAPDRSFAFRAGLQFHVSAYGMYGFAILSSMNFRQTMHFAVKYHLLATPLAQISFEEKDGRGTWSILPIAHPRIDVPLYKFLVELQLGIHLSLHRDVMGPDFVPREIQLTYGSPSDAARFATIFGCPVCIGSTENRLLFDAAWLDGVPHLGNEITYAAILQMCDELYAGIERSLGTVGKVRELLLVNLMRPTTFEAVAKHLHMTSRTLRRKLSAQNESFRKLLEQLRMQMAIKYLRDTDMTIEDVAQAVGFSDAANFRHAFRRWTGLSPLDFRSGQQQGEPARN